MDYEKAYREALAKARELYNDEQTHVGMTPIHLTEIFPELKESEERIRTFLHHTFTAQYLCKDKLGKWHGEPVVNILSWLEKQCEPEKQKGETLSGWWVARDKDGNLYVYSVKPERNGDSWVVADSQNLWKMPNILFSDLKWEDEPMELDVTLKPKTT